MALVIPVAHEVVPHEGLHHALGDGGGHSGPSHAVAATPSQLGVKDVPVKPRGRGSRSRCPKDAAPLIKDDFPLPPIQQSKNGRLNVDLTAGRTSSPINGQSVLSATFNSFFPAPLLVFCPGDSLRVLVNNGLNPADFAGPQPAVTNLHTHGFHVSPNMPHDNIFVEIQPGQSFQYKYPIPRDHPPGAYWYHPHLHGQTNPQAFEGMVGPMVIKGGLDVQEGWNKIPTRVVVIQQTAVQNGATVRPGPKGPFVPPGAELTINGRVNPEIDIQPGELQRWRIFNATAGTFVDLQLQDQPLRILATDGNNLPSMRTRTSELIAPASRREILVRGGPRGTATPLVALPFAAFGPTPSPQQTLATLVSSGPKKDVPKPPRKLNAQQPDLRKEKINNFHNIVYSQEPPNFFINGRQFSGPNDVAEVMKLGKVAQWTINNTTTFWHTFHIHINDFQVTQINGVDVKKKRFDDNFAVSPGGSFTMLYKPREYTGKFVFHCHVLGHEDNGMMGVVEVLK